MYDEKKEDKEYKWQMGIWGTFISTVYWLLFVAGAFVLYEHPGLVLSFAVTGIMTAITAWLLWALKMEREWNW